jgi:hypothetical protein
MNIRDLDRRNYLGGIRQKKGRRSGELRRRARRSRVMTQSVSRGDELRRHPPAPTAAGK